ncbi:MAG: hypothetical protein HN704_07865 [Bacteroidetes bacterium]|jgi:hypothetical protein|nr:hypothetical protein [Bacteroidota bacterium]MBT6685003.1 hypothetical protein [Bacteroidota bacterium]MBT7143081.1 hypothetical protein [Bacteroidota bacterium]MBT7491506.1 hypothetical protein [Bacteroidota bacterium]
MNNRTIYLGENKIKTQSSEISGQFVEIENEKFYKIQNYHEMPDFFISIVSDSDLWMFISSNGSLSAGRKDRNNALFPYYTVDKIHDYKCITGSKSCFLIHKNEKTFLWEPFTNESQKTYDITRNLYKNIYGNKIIFEEINSDLEISFSYSWNNSEKFGFVKKSSLVNLSQTKTKIEFIDGITNILPFGLDYLFQNEYSNLLDAYKKNERIEGSTLALFMLSSIPVDKAEPSEALKLTTVWSTGIAKDSKILVSEKQVNKFRNGFDIESEYDVRASRGAYFVNSHVDLNKNENSDWFTIAELNQGSTDVANLNNFIIKTKKPTDFLIADIEQGTENLKKMVSFADGFQMTNTDLSYARHYSNTLYNIMRGGVFVNNYSVKKDDFELYLLQINKLITKEYQSWISHLPDEISYSNLINLAEQTGDTDLIRITNEYLPLTFSRRHGDPSRPWNLFSIETKKEDGQTKYYYEGNWRDIFQNWEALCFSYPQFIEGIISKFLNASTIDGYNPYRIMRDGIDWESPHPDDPWAYIGYWGDHQIIYLQKLLELSNNFHPGKLDNLLVSEIFTYANVPYKIKSYNEIVQNPKDTVVFDVELNKKIRTEVELLGADASLLKYKSGDNIYKVNLTEKILVSLLSKLSNFIPEAGIWLNTQRPEWNDANNALVGNGTSMVTLYYLRRFLKFWQKKFQEISFSEISISIEVETLFTNIYNFFLENVNLINTGFSDKDRRKFANYLGEAHTKYRNEIYNYSFSGEKSNIKVKELLDFTKVSLKYIDQSIKINKRKDGLYHAYNLISIRKKEISIRNLYEMLEGQVAVLSSGLLTAKESLDVLDSLKNSAMFREDQNSYMLYPDRQLPRFINKNIIPKKFVEESALFTKLIADKETSIIKVDKEGEFHFNGTFRNREVLEEVLNGLRVGSYSHLIELEKDKILDIYEQIFDHQSFTGRSGTFYGYEGLGSIYWHMVSKLLLATQENYFAAKFEGANANIINHLQDHYYEIKAGIGVYKSPDLYGAFPTDAYSHTPSNTGVKQPGLTGQVKEDIISKIGELGLRIKQGKIFFEPTLFNHEEILDRNRVFEYYNIKGENCKVELSKNHIAFTFCQTPIVYTFSDKENISVSFKNGNTKYFNGNSIDEQTSDLIFSRTGEVELVEVTLNNIKNAG